MRFTVLIKGFYWPALQIQGDDPLGTPLDAIRHQYDIRAGQLWVFEAHYQAHFAQAGQTHSQGKGPVGGVSHRHGTLCSGWGEGHQLVHGNVWPRQADGCACRILEDKAVSLQMPILLQQADPIFFPVARHGPQLFSKRPAIKQEDAKGHFVLNRRLAQRNAEVDFGTKLLMELLKVWIFQQAGINFLMESCPFLLGRWDGAARTVFLDKGVPLGEFFIASIQSKVYGETDVVTDVRTGDGIMRQGIGVVAMVVMAVHIVEETAHMLA